MNDGVHQLAIAPQAEAIAVRVDQVRQVLQPLPLFLVVLVLEAARIGTFAGRLELDESDQRALHGHGVIGTNLQVGEGRFADRDHLARREAAQPRELCQQLLERGTKLVFGAPTAPALLSFCFALAPNKETTASSVVMEFAAPLVHNMVSDSLPYACVKAVTLPASHPAPRLRLPSRPSVK